MTVEYLIHEDDHEVEVFPADNFTSVLVKEEEEEDFLAFLNVYPPVSTAEVEAWLEMTPAEREKAYPGD
jgi:hypothetical protein